MRLGAAASWLGHRGREILLTPALLQRGGPRVAFLPSAAGAGSGELRAVRIAAELRRQGWTTICLPPQLELGQRERVLRRFGADLLVFQKCRHPLNRAGLNFGLPFVLDLDDADFDNPVLGLALEDLARGARTVIAGSRHIRDWAEAAGARAHVVWTGTPITRGPRPPHSARPRVIGWAQAEPLGYPDEMDFLRPILREVARAIPDVTLRLYGVNGPAAAAGLGRSFDFIRLDLRPSLPYDAFLTSLRDLSLGLSPIIPASPFSRGKSFGKILGYLDAQVPVICSDEADHALFFTPDSGVVSNDPEVWTRAILRLMADPSARQAMAETAFAGFQARLSLEATAARVGQVLRGAL